MLEETGAKAGGVVDDEGGMAGGIEDIGVAVEDAQAAGRMGQVGGEEVDGHAVDFRFLSFDFQLAPGGCQTRAAQ